MAVAPQQSWLLSQVGTFIAAVAVALTVVGGVGRLVLAPIDEFQIDTKDAIRQINLTMVPLLALAAQIKEDDHAFARIQIELDGKADKDVIAAALASIAKETDDNKTSTLRAAEEVVHQVHDLEANIVTRNENAEHWAEIDSRIKSIEDRLAALERLPSEKVVPH
jgi:hypothetical protein